MENSPSTFGSVLKQLDQCIRQANEIHAHASSTVERLAGINTTKERLQHAPPDHEGILPQLSASLNDLQSLQSDTLARMRELGTMFDEEIRGGSVMDAASLL